MWETYFSKIPTLIEIPFRLTLHFLCEQDQFVRHKSVGETSFLEDYTSIQTSCGHFFHVPHMRKGKSVILQGIVRRLFSGVFKQSPRAAPSFTPLMVKGQERLSPEVTEIYLYNIRTLILQSFSSFFHDPYGEETSSFFKVWQKHSCRKTRS